MKDDHPRKLLIVSSFKKSIKGTAYVILLVFAYAFGIYSAYPASNKRSSKLEAPPQQSTEVEFEPDHFRFRTRCADPVPSKLVRQAILDRIFNGTSPYDGFPPAHVRPLLKQKRVKGWGSTGAVFENLIRKVKPRTIIEVGSFLGASAIHMAELSRGLGVPAEILCVDDFRGWPGFRDRFADIGLVNGDVMLMYQFMQNVAHYNATEMILPVPFSTSSALSALCEWGVLGDLIEVDAGHDFHSAWSDINMAYAILRPGGVMFGHDYFTSAHDRGVRRAVNLFARVKGLRVQLDGQHWVLLSD